jgi:hypothetical protein
LRQADSTSLGITTVLTQADLDRRAEDESRRQRLQDSVRAAAAADSIRQTDSTRAPAVAPPVRPAGRRPGAQVAPPSVPVARDSARPPPRPSAAIPVAILFLQLAEPLPAGTAFRLRAEDITSVSQATRTSERVFTTPRARPRPDTTAARPAPGNRDGRQ